MAWGASGGRGCLGGGLGSNSKRRTHVRKCGTLAGRPVARSCVGGPEVCCPPAACLLPPALQRETAAVAKQMVATREAELGALLVASEARCEQLRKDAEVLRFDAARAGALEREGRVLASRLSEAQAALGAAEGELEQATKEQAAREQSAAAAAAATAKAGAGSAHREQELAERALGAEAEVERLRRQLTESQTKQKRAGEVATICAVSSMVLAIIVNAHK